MRTLNEMRGEDLLGLNSLKVDLLKQHDGAMSVGIHLLRNMVTALEDFDREVQHLQDVVNTLKAGNTVTSNELQQVTQSEQFYSDVVHGEIKDYQIVCDEGTVFFVTPRVLFDVKNETETHVSDCATLQDAERYCKQLNIEDRFGDGRVSCESFAGAEYGEFITTHAQMLKELVKVPDDVKGYLDTIPDEE